MSGRACSPNDSASSDGPANAGGSDSWTVQDVAINANASKLMNCDALVRMMRSTTPAYDGSAKSPKFTVIWPVATTSLPT